MAQKNGNVEWRGFSNVPLTKSQKIAAKKRGWGPGECFLYLESLAAEGYRVTISQDPEGAAFTVGATGRVENAGMTMTQRHSNLDVAVMAHATAHLDVTSQKWPEPMAPLLDIDW